MSYKWPGIPNGDYSFDHGRAVWNKIINYLRRLSEKLDSDIVDATADRHGMMTAADKDKLDGVEPGAEVNQNAFSGVKVGNSTIEADGKTDVLELVAGNAITLTPDTANDKVTIAVIPDVYAVRDDDLLGNELTRTSAAGRTAVALRRGENNSDAYRAEVVDFGWDYSDRDGALIGLFSTSHTNDPGAFYIHARDANNDRTLRGRPDGTLTWDGNKVITIVDTATQSTNGVMSSTDKTKLDNLPAWSIANSAGRASGAMIGASNPAICALDNESHITIVGGMNTAAASGAKLVLNGAERTDSEGRFVLQAGNANEYKQFIGKPDGTLTWDGTDVIYTHPSHTARTGKPTSNQTPSFGDTFTVSQITSDNTGHVTNATDRTVKIPDSTATQSVNGLMSADDKKKLDDSIFTDNGTVSFYGVFAAYITTSATEIDFLIPLAYIPSKTPTSATWSGLTLRKPTGGTLNLSSNYTFTLQSITLRKTGIEIRLKSNTAIDITNNTSFTMIGTISVTF